MSNNKENGYHLLAQPKGSNVHATSYPNPNPETEIQIYKSHLCLGVTKIYLAYMILILIQKSKTQQQFRKTKQTLPKHKNPNPKLETEILIYKSLLCLGATQKSS